MKKAFITSALVLTVATLGLPKTAQADMYGCNTNYGTNCVPETIIINKTVQNPGDNTFVDNLGVNDPKYQPNSTVTFHIDVTNPNQDTLTNLTVKDTFPSYITFTGGAGTFDKNSNILTFTVDSLASNQTKEYTVTAQTADTNNLPSDQGVTCVTNQAEVSGSNVYSKDTAQFCIVKPVLGTTKGGQPVFAPQPVKHTPSTGPEALPLLALIPGGLFGHLLRKKSQKTTN